ncbi:MAG: hypothetical protein AAF492_10215, partial [Verrucomicrobiota bacterium]
MRQIVTGLLFLSSLTVSATASDPTAIYALITEARVTPNEEKPEHLLLKGTFSIGVIPSHGRGFRHYQDQPKNGSLYFKLPAGEKERKISLIEWKDILALVKKDGKACVGLGAFHASKGVQLATLRKADAKPENPDPYHITS